MVLGRAVALIVKGRDGRTVLFQSRGLDVQLASRAASEALATLQAAGQTAEPWDILSDSQSAPLLCSRLDGMHGGLSVTYRVAGGLIFLVVSEPSANVFGCVGLLGKAVRVVMGPSDGKAVEMTPERVQRRFGEMYLAFDALLGSGGVLEAHAALGQALACLEQLHDKDKDRVKGGPEGPKTPPQQQPQAASARSGTRRTLQGAIDQLALLSFSAGNIMDRIPPLPGFQMQDTATGAGAHRAGAQQDPFALLQGPGAFAPQSTAKSADPFGDDDIFSLLSGDAKAKAKAGPAAVDPLDPFAASDTAPADWTAFNDADKKPQAGAKAEAGTVGFEDDAFAAAPAPPVPSEPVLRLSEMWRGEAAGGRLVRAGLCGRVEWVSEGAKAKVHTVQFMVQVPEAPNEHLAAALSAARRHSGCCRAGRVGGVLLADGILAKPHPGEPLLCYHLPPVACQPPLQARLGTSWQVARDGRRLVTLGLHYAVSPRLAPHAAGLEVDLNVPALLGLPLRVAPGGAVFDGGAHVLRWKHKGPVKTIDNTGAATEPCVATFLVEEAVADEAALTGALGRASARLVLRGADNGGSISGAGLAQGVVDLELTPKLCGWRAEMTATM